MADKVAVLGTSQVRKIEYNENNEPVSVELTWGFNKLLSEGFTIYVATTRLELFPDSWDKCWMDIIPKERIFKPEVAYGSELLASVQLELHRSMMAQSPLLVDMWVRIFKHLNIDLTEDIHRRMWSQAFGKRCSWEYISWTELRQLAKDSGVTVNLPLKNSFRRTA